MSARLPLFSDGEFPFAEPPTRRCYWCNGAIATWYINTVHALNGADLRYCTTAQDAFSWSCANVPPDLAAVVLDRVAELPRRYARVRVEVDRIDADEFDSFARTNSNWLSYYRMNDGAAISAICLAHPTDSQHLAACLMHDPDIASLLEGVRAEHGVEPLSPAAIEAYRTRADAARGPMMRQAMQDASDAFRQYAESQGIDTSPEAERARMRDMFTSLREYLAP